MDDFISREDAIDNLCESCFMRNCSHDCDAVKAIRGTKPADVVEVVRCKDCRFYYKDSDGYEMCDNSEGYDHISADGFCAWAERRSDND